ncbi:MAG TPA: hypothetical protein DHN29_00500 [Cytophagales bacterium]|nr:hypothetical protein [Cytophagales bacterium]
MAHQFNIIDIMQNIKAFEMIKRVRGDSQEETYKLQRWLTNVIEETTELKIDLQAEDQDDLLDHERDQ